MDSIDFKQLKPTNFPDGAYLVILAGAAPVDGVVLLRMKVVVGWPNPILTTLQALQDSPRGLLAAVHQFLQGPFNKSLFNMAVYEVDETPHAAAIFGPLSPNMLVNKSFTNIFQPIETHLIIK